MNELQNDKAEREMPSAGAKSSLESNRGNSKCMNMGSISGMFTKPAGQSAHSGCSVWFLVQLHDHKSPRSWLQFTATSGSFSINGDVSGPWGCLKYSEEQQRFQIFWVVNCKCRLWHPPLKKSGWEKLGLLGTFTLPLTSLGRAV